jgi:glycosyltransferase involved in cell wall biosynthesis
MEKQMKIAYFTDTFTPEINGVTNTLSKLSRYLETKDIQHAFFTSDYSNGGVKEPDMLSGKKRVHRFPGIRLGISPESCLAFPKKREIIGLCDSFAPDLVHVATEFGIGYKGLKYAVSRDAPLIMSSHTDYCKYLKFHNLNVFEPAVEKYLKWFYSFSDKTLVPSEHSRKQLELKGYKNLGIWSRGIDTGKFNAGFRSTEVRNGLGTGDKFAFLYVGRLSAEKGLHMLLHAIGEINNLFPGRAVFIFTGDGPYADNIKQAGFENVIMTGFKRAKELSEIYASCDCFAFPSGTETFGNTPLEAMASGLPVAGVKSGGITDFLTHNYNSLLSEDGDNEAFTQNLISIMESQELKRELSINAVKTALTRDWDEIFDALINDYSDLVERKSALEKKYAS